MSIISLITKDIKAENESKKVIVALRVLYLAVLAAFILNIILGGLSVIEQYWRTLSALLGAGIILLIHTYHSKTKLALGLFMLYLFLFSILLIPIFGWRSGFQNYFIIILIIVFFGNYGKLRYRFFFSGIVLAARIVLILIAGGVSSGAHISSNIDKAVQIVNISIVFLSIIYLSYTFSKTENEAENKLLRYNDRLQKEANTDQLTGLFNRRKAREFLDELVSVNDGNSISIAIGDIDFFKKVNDTHGHDAGDEVLMELSKLMCDALRSNSFVSRWGGEEFLIIFPECNGDQANVALERLRRAIEQNVMYVNGIEIRVTMTFGLAEYDFGGDIEQCIKEADKKLYMGKQNGRNQVVY